MTGHVARRKGLRKKLDLGTQLGMPKEEYKETTVSMRAKVEHTFRVVKQQFGINKRQTMFALAKLWLMRKKLFAAQARARPHRPKQVKGCKRGCKTA